MKKLMIVIATLIVVQQAIAQENIQTPDRFLGKYVPVKADCKTSNAVVLVGKYETIIKYKNDSMTVKHEVCTVCIGGARATGEWITLSGKAIDGQPYDSFGLSFDEHEIELDFPNASANKRFGGMSGLLKKCH